MESYTKKINRQYEISVGKEVWQGEELFNFLCTVLMDVISDNDLTPFDIKDLVIQISEEMELIPIENIRP